LNAIAAVLAPTKQTTTPKITPPFGIPPAAKNIAANPNGIANTVCSNLINSAHLLITEDILGSYHTLLLQV
jgi:hypothetical protein